MNLRVAHPLRSLQRVGYANVCIEILGSHPSQKARRTWISCYAAPSMAACAAFSKESRMKFANANKPRQEIRGMGHPEVGGRARNVPSGPKGR
jgi:hypothetical protein